MPTAMPDIVKRLTRVPTEVKAVSPLLGHTLAFNTDKARRVVGFAPRSAEKTIADFGGSRLG